MEEIGQLMNPLPFHLEMEWQIGLTVQKEPNILSIRIRFPRKAE